MRLLTCAYLVEKYGLRLSVVDLADVMSLSQHTVRNQISAGSFPIKTYLEGGRRWASYEAVGEYLDEIAKLAV